MRQTKLCSFLEASVNILSGMVLAFTLSQVAHIYEAEIQKYIWQDFVWNLSAESNLVMTSILTAVSLIRSFIWRRIFNGMQRGKHETKKD